MGNESVILKTVCGKKKSDLPATRVAFSAHQCFAFDGGEEDKRVIEALGEYLQRLDGLAFYGEGRMVGYFLQHAPYLQEKIGCLIFNSIDSIDESYGLEVKLPEHLPSDIKHIFLCETLTFDRMQMKKRLPKNLVVIEPDDIRNIAPEAIPTRAWTSLEHNIYPIDIPDIDFKESLDLLLIDCPSRNLSMMPNGLGYVHNALKKTSINFQTFDLDIIVYHRYHIHRLFDMGGKIILPSGKEAPTDPWQAEHYDFWTLGSEHDTERRESHEVLAFFRPLIDEIIAKIVNAKPKMLGLSIQQCNEAFSRQVVLGVKEQLPDTLILVGGYSCYNPDIGRRAFPECDYMFIGEAELTVGPVVNALARGEKSFNQPGVLSRFDTPDYQYIPGPMPHNLDQIEFPKYEWFNDLTIYQNYNGYQLTPIIASRGCRWSRCTFCAERFYWRIRSAPNFVNELHWLIDQGCYLFMFNESDLNGMPEKVLEICDEVIGRGLHRKAKLTGQLRVHKKCNRAFYDKLRAANFVALRFGVDAFSENTLRLQKKGYTIEMASQNLKDCWEAGIFTEVNWVIGVPGETDQDVEEGIEMILRNQKYIGRLANINPLIIVNGGVYWIDPETHNIVFREPKEKLYDQFPRALPASMWYSTDPYIDAYVRKERFEKIVVSLYEAGFPVGAWANRVIEDVKLARDKMRSVGDADSDQLQISSEATEPLPEEIYKVASNHEVSEIPLKQKTVDSRIEAKTEEESEIVTEPAVLLHVTDTHKIVSYLGWYYAIPAALGEIDLSSCDMSSLDGVVRAVSEDDLRNLLSESVSWANSRGNYTSQKRQREQGADYRAGSFVGARASDPLEFDPLIVTYENRYYAVRKEHWQNIREGRPHDGDLGQTASSDKSEVLITGNSLGRRLFRKLPHNLQLELRCIGRAAKCSETLQGRTLSDKELMLRLIKEFFSNRTRRVFGKDIKGVVKNEKITGAQVIGVISEGAVPELMWSIEEYNIVNFDYRFYAVPFGLSIDWESGTVASLPGVLVDKSLKGVMNLLEDALGRSLNDYVANTVVSETKRSGPAEDFSIAPKLLGNIDDYNVVSYEGWVYGIPRDLGNVDLTETDIMEVSGVIRDVSRDVVENEIQEKLRLDAVAN